MKTSRLPSGRSVPVLGQGTWRMGEDRAARQREITTLRLGLDLGLTLIDTAEMYGDGGAEELVAHALAGRRDAAFVVTKVYPQNAGARSMPAACDRSLRRLGLDCIDLYQVHVPDPDVPYAETVGAFVELRDEGKVRDIGISNVTPSHLAEAEAIAPVVCVQNAYGIGAPAEEQEFLRACGEKGVAYVRLWDELSQTNTAASTER